MVMICDLFSRDLEWIHAYKNVPLKVPFGLICVKNGTFYIDIDNWGVVADKWIL